MVITIKDVAKETGLAISTISKFMNGGNVRVENKKKIEIAIERLGYKPNEFARSLRGAKTATVGIIVDNLKAIFSAQIVGLIEKKLKSRGYSVLLGSHGNDCKIAKEVVELLVDKQVDAIIIEPLTDGTEYLKIAEENEIPIISIDRVLDSKRYDSITTNSMLGVYDGVEYLIQKGHEKIAIIAATREGTMGINSGKERLRGYLMALEDYNIPVRKEFIVKGDFSFTSGCESMKTIWNLSEKPTAILVSNYHMCLGMIAATHELEIKIPEDVSVVTFDDMQFFRNFNPKLTAIGQPIEEIAMHVEEVVLKRIAGDYSDFPLNLKLRTHFVERDSVKKNYRKLKEV